jgi:hypothetical protein
MSPLVSSTRRPSPTSKSLFDHEQHGLGLAADAVHDQRMPSLPLAAQRDGRYQRDVLAVDLALCRCNPRERLQTLGPPAAERCEGP